jgi:hypothetical protein
MGSLDQSTGASVKRKIKIVDLTGLTVAQIENQYNNNYGSKGWKFLQYAEIAGTRYVIAEKEEA